MTTWQFRQCQKFRYKWCHLTNFLNVSFNANNRTRGEGRPGAVPTGTRRRRRAEIFGGVETRMPPRFVRRILTDVNGSTSASVNADAGATGRTAGTTPPEGSEESGNRQPPSERTFLGRRELCQIVRGQLSNGGSATRPALGGSPPGTPSAKPGKGHGPQPAGRRQESSGQFV